MRKTHVYALNAGCPVKMSTLAIPRGACWAHGSEVLLRFSVWLVGPVGQLVKKQPLSGEQDAVFTPPGYLGGAKQNRAVQLVSIAVIFNFLQNVETLL